MSLLDDVEAYVARRGAADWSSKSVRLHRHTLGRFAAFMEERGHRRWSSVTPEDIDAWAQSLIGRGLARSSRDTFAYSVRGFSAWLTETGKVITNPARDLRVLDEDEVDLPPQPLSEEQVAEIFASVPRDGVINLRNLLHLELLYSAGLRGGEAVALDLGDLDLDRRTILVRDGKGARSRLVPLLASGMAAAADYLALRRELLQGPDHGALLLGADGGRLKKHYMQNWLLKRGRHLGFRVFPHLLRHSIAVHLLRRGADIRHIQQFLGHADLESTAIYLRLVPGHLREDYDRAAPVLADVEQIA